MLQSDEYHDSDTDGPFSLVILIKPEYSEAKYHHPPNDE
jgi:hypothetical protein